MRINSTVIHLKNNLIDMVSNQFIGNRSEFTVLGLLSIGIKILLPLKQKFLVLDKIDYSQGLQLLI